MINRKIRRSTGFQKMRASKSIKAYRLGLDENDLQFRVTFEDWQDPHHNSKISFKKGEVYSYEELVYNIQALIEDSFGYCNIESEYDKIELWFRTFDTGDNGEWADEDSIDESMPIEHVVLKCEIVNCDKIADLLDDSVSGTK